MPEVYALCQTIVCKYHVFFTYLSGDGHIGCFQELAFINCAVINISIHASQ